MSYLLTNFFPSLIELTTPKQLNLLSLYLNLITSAPSASYNTAIGSFSIQTKPSGN